MDLSSNRDLLKLQTGIVTDESSSDVTVKSSTAVLQRRSDRETNLLPIVKVSSNWIGMSLGAGDGRATSMAVDGSDS